MHLATVTISIIAVLALGLSAGASLAEVATLVPFWQKLEPASFYGWYTANKDILVAFYSPLQVYSAAIALAGAVLHFVAKDQVRILMAVAALLALGVLATFFIYFKEANAALAAGPMGQAELNEALSSWASWQWVRIGLGTSAFVCATVALLKRG